MIKTANNNKLYFCSIALLCALTYFLNVATGIYQCALVFTVLALVVNGLTSKFSKTKALVGLATAVTVSFLLMGKLPYYIDGKIINGLVTASLASVMISLYWSATIFQKLGSKFSFAISNVLSIIAAAVVDGVIMGAFFIINNNLSYARVADIFIREVSYKTLYSLVASAIIVAAMRMLKQNRSTI